jgi:phosphoserine phosphatase
MTLNQDSEQFTGLILLTGVDKPGIASALFETLSPFSISILDIEQLVISDRLILTVLIGLNPSHQKAIEADLEECASSNEVDIATLFAARPLLKAKSELIDVVIETEKLHPKTIAEITSLLKKVGSNIEQIARVAGVSLTINIVVSGSKLEEVSKLLESVNFEDGSKVYVKAHG